MSSDQNSPPPAAPDIFERLGGTLIKLVASLVLGSAISLAGFFVLIWADQHIDIADMITAAPHLNDTPVSDGAAATVTGRLEVKKPANDPLLPNAKAAFVVRRVQVCTVVEVAPSDDVWQQGTTEKQDVEPPLVAKWVDYRPELINEKSPDDLRPLRSVGAGLSVAGRELTAVPEVLGGHVVAPAPGTVIGAKSIDEQWVYMDTTTTCIDQDSIGTRRMSFEVLRAGDLVTAFGKSWQDELRPWHGQLILGLGGRDGLSERIGNRRERRAWWVRGVGATILWIGLMVLLEPALTVLGVVPILGGLMRGAATLLTMLTALALTLGFVFLGWGRPILNELFWGILR